MVLRQCFLKEDFICDSKTEIGLPETFNTKNNAIAKGEYHESRQDHQKRENLYLGQGQSTGNSPGGKGRKIRLGWR